VSIQTYECPKHGEFEVFQAFADDVKPTYKCPRASLVGCGRISQHVLKPIATAIVQGGTGGGKDMHLPR